MSRSGLIHNRLIECIHNGEVEKKENDNTNDNSSLLDTVVGLQNYILKQKVCLENRIQRADMGRFRLLVNLEIRE